MHYQVMPRQQQFKRSGKLPAVDGYSEDAEKLKKTVHELQRELELSRAREEKAEVGPTPKIKAFRGHRKASCACLAFTAVFQRDCQGGTVQSLHAACRASQSAQQWHEVQQVFVMHCVS